MLEDKMVGSNSQESKTQGSTPPVLYLTPAQAEAARRAAAREVPEAAALPEGHPVRVMRAENVAMMARIDGLKQALAAEELPADFSARFLELSAVRVHFAKKEELLMPLLYQYGVTGPSDVMWRDDDAMKKELAAIARSLQASQSSKDSSRASVPTCDRERVRALLSALVSMTKKEDAILFPLALRYFTDEEWYAVYDDAIDMGTAFGVTPVPWEPAEAWRKAQVDAALARTYEDGHVQFPTGALTVQELREILSLIGVDITFIDAADHLRFFLNEGKVFARPKLALGRPVYDCHPTQIVPAVKQLLDDFKAKRRDHMTVWRRINGKPIGVHYHAVYDARGTYLGAVEFVQDVSEAVAHFAADE